MRLQLDADTDKKLNAAIKVQPNMLEDIFFEYVAASQGYDEDLKQALLTDLLAAQYRAIVYGDTK